MAHQVHLDHEIERPKVQRAVASHRSSGGADSGAVHVDVYRAESFDDRVDGGGDRVRIGDVGGMCDGIGTEFGGGLLDEFGVAVE